jgi:hypothetical protein
MNVSCQFVFVLVFGTACWATGDFILKFFSRNIVSLPLLTRYTLAFCAGNIAFSYLLAALGFAGLFIPSVLLVMSFAGTGLAVWRIAAEFWERAALKEEQSKPVRCKRGNNLYSEFLRGDQPAIGSTIPSVRPSREEGFFLLLFL